MPEPDDLKIEVKEGDSYSYSLPKIIDLNGDKVTVSLETSAKFITLNDFKILFQKIEKEGSYNIKLTLLDSRGGSSVYDFKAIIKFEKE